MILISVICLKSRVHLEVSTDLICYFLSFTKLHPIQEMQYLYVQFLLINIIGRFANSNLNILFHF